jgi:hypothetical protein
MWLLAAALFGLVVPNGLFLHWVATEYHGFGAVLDDRLAVAFILDATMALLLVSAYFARHPIGPVRWTWFVVLSLAGGLGFSLPFYWWLNMRRTSGTRAVGHPG